MNDQTHDPSQDPSQDPSHEPGHDPSHDPRHDDRLGERLQRAVGDLRAPDVVAVAVARGRRQRARRRAVYGAGGLAAATALALTVPALAGDLLGQDAPSGTATLPAAAPSAEPDPSPSAAQEAPTDAGEQECGPRTGWWSTPPEEVREDLAALLPASVSIGRTQDSAVGVWGGDLLVGDDPDFASLTLLPPPGVPGGWQSLEEIASGSCEDLANEPAQAVAPCDELGGYSSCEEVLDGDGTQVGVVTEKVEQTVVDGQDRPTGRSYVVATLAVPGGGHVELLVSAGTRADRPSTVVDPDDAPALTPEQALAVVTDPVWTR